MASTPLERGETTPASGPREIDAPDAIAFLTKEHRAVEKLFAQFEKAGDQGRKQELATRICHELLSHMQVEEEIFYPATRHLLDDDGVVKEGLVEHESGRDRIEKILDMDASDELFDAEIHVLSEQMKHHHHEEEDEYFPEVEKTGLDLEALGARLKARKRELMAQLAKRA